MKNRSDLNTAVGRINASAHGLVPILPKLHHLKGLVKGENEALSFLRAKFLLLHTEIEERVFETGQDIPWDGA